ncbi:5-methylcytosine-specific restriction enzyme B [uncultured Clostridium sp.]|uniref:AAA family ATPase n=1 Tax=Paeniclostridium hominis TaxID=2764329 RepID=A0ABR7K156_9FIRM|nr:MULTISPECIES: AAA family ATPase [Paeniclostridium]MBC6002736.1 AAA family ATPase [Paeniclostridium hominis]MBC8630424.1 AAA family ATPase [[Eubacterium] tenue]SCI92710.1 5-methylcytosine-specific restriction enzyme B [uncultured Clostridium sp.]SCJ04819.1 5-methylcytosine-specific restriction enzyme B [uncultured Clostridium sp.]
MAKDIVIDFLTKLSLDIENKANVDISYSQQRDYFSSGKILGQPIYYVFKYFRKEQQLGIYIESRDSEGAQFIKDIYYEKNESISRKIGYEIGISERKQNKDWVRMGFEIDVDNFSELMEYRKLYFHAFLKFKSSIEKIVEKYVDAIFNFTGNFGYTKTELLREVFMDEEVLDDIIFNLEQKKNIILQGPSGVGKTFIAKRICYFHQGNRDNSNIEMVQFHEYYTYEEFVRGYRRGKNGEDYIKNGIFYDFIKKAQTYPEHKHYFIIDEINRGNLNKIFGELTMLIENNKRGKENSIKLLYSECDESFYIPENVYIIGTLNTSDNTLKDISYPLRRRFGFIDIDPVFENMDLRNYLGNYIGVEMADKVVCKMMYLNKTIEEDNKLGKRYKIGQSYFMINEKVDEYQVYSWYRQVIKRDIEPLIREYMIDKDEEYIDNIIKNLIDD